MYKKTSEYSLLSGEEEHLEVTKNTSHVYDLEISYMKSNELLQSCSYNVDYKIIDKYFIGRFLGSGSYGEVHEAVNYESLGRFAVKVLNIHSIFKIAFGRVNILNEIRVLKMCSHSNIIKMHDLIFNQNEETIYLVLDFCICSLEDFITLGQNKKLPECQASFYFIQIMHGLEYLHSRGIIHNDIKPSNLLLEVSHNLKICDFGTVTILDPFKINQLLDNNFGTPSFQPPEVVNNPDGYFGESKDVWSAGVTLYYIVIGDLPFKGDNIGILYLSITNDEPKLDFPFVDPDFQDLIKKMLVKDYQNRAKICEIKIHPWLIKNHIKKPFVQFPGIDENYRGGLDFDSSIINQKKMKLSTLI